MARLVITLTNDAWRECHEAARLGRLPSGVGVTKPFSLRDCIPGLGWRPWTDLPEGKVRIFTSLGFALVEVEEKARVQTLAALASLQEVTTVSEEEVFEIITPVGGFREIDLAGNDIPSWHLHLVGIDALHGQGVTGLGVTVGVLDSGVDPTTQPIADRILASATFDDSGATVEQPMIDPYGHGTHVCGIIVGSEFGVAPEAKIVLGRIAPAGATSFAKILGGLEWLCSFPEIRIINLSIGKIDSPPVELLTLVSRLEALGKLLVCAIGNDGEGTSRTPANIRGVLGIGAVDIDKQVASFSGGMEFDGVAAGYMKPDMVMPGVDIPSCWIDGKIRLASGTSQATPMATGLAALALQMMPTLTTSELRETVLRTCVDLPVPPIRDGAGLPEGSRLKVSDNRIKLMERKRGRI